MTTGRDDDDKVAQSRAAAIKARERAVQAREEAAVSREDASAGEASAVALRETAALTREEAVQLREEVMRAREEAAAAKDHLKDANERLILEAIRSRELAEEAQEQRRLLQESHEALVKAVRFGELLIGVVSHDLRSPLSAVWMAVEFLTHKGDLDAQSRSFIVRIRQSTLRMSEMITQLLDLTRAHSGNGLPIAPRPSNLAEICRRDVAELELGQSMPGRFVCEFGGDMNGTWDPDRLAQVISNIGRNAIEHGTPGTAIALRTHDEGDWVVLEISNQGEPIPSNILPFVFDPFRRATPPPKSISGGGLGLGLYISNQIVLAHGGTIAVRSSASEGTTFSVRLPRYSPAPNEHGVSARP